MSTRRRKPFVPLTFGPHGPQFSEPSTAECWLPSRPGFQFVAGPFESDAELRQAWDLLTQPVKGSA